MPSAINPPGYLVDWLVWVRGQTRRIRLDLALPGDWCGLPPLVAFAVNRGINAELRLPRLDKGTRHLSDITGDVRQ